MNSHNYKNEIIDDNDEQRFRRISPNWYNKTKKLGKPSLYEQTLTTTTTTTINKETNTKTDEMTTTQLEKSPMRRVNLVTGPQSAFARLFPNKYRQEQEEYTRQHQRSKSSSSAAADNQRYNFDRYKSNDDDDYGTVRKSRRVILYDGENDEYLSNQTDFNNRAKFKQSYQEDISRIPLNYDPDPEIVYRDNPNKITYVQKVGVRYLKPPTPPPSEPIIIRERHATPPQEPPPMVISTTP